MTHLRISRIARRNLLGGISALIVATALLPSIAAAQTRAVSSDGAVTLTTNQDSRDAGISAVTLSPATIVRTGPETGTTLHVDANLVAATTTANAADAALDFDNRSGLPAGSFATVQPTALNAEAPALIIGRQAVQHATVSTDAYHSSADLTMGGLDRVQVSVSANAARGTARANDHVASLATVGSGGGIALLQSIDTSSVMAQQSGTATLRGGDVAGSTIAFADNEQGATAVANAASASLSAEGSIVPDATDSLRTHVVDGLTTARAASVVAQRQTASGSTIARVGNALPSGDLIDLASVADSNLAAERNSIAASGTGNLASTRLAIDAPSIARPGGVGAALTVQQLDGQVQGSAQGATALHIAGTTNRSILSATGNVMRSVSTGNAADAAMTVNAAVLDTSPPGGGGLPPHGPAGTAVITDDGGRATSAAMAVHTDQRVGVTSVSANVVRSGVTAELEGQVRATTINVSDNRQEAQAVGNDASSALDIASPAFSSSADVLVSQTSDASIGASAGQAASPGAAIVSLGSLAYGAQLNVTGNALQSMAVANRSDARLSLDSAQAADGGDHRASRAGSLDDGYGASATLALSSVQSVGKDGAQPTVTGQSDGRFGVDTSSDVSTSALAVEDNVQSAGAIANSGNNSLTLSSPVAGGAGTALLSSQFGAAKVSANSAMRISAPGLIEHSAVSLGGNTNQASASANEVSNRLSAGGVGAVSLPATVSADTLGAADAQGLNVLDNQQFAMGAVTAGAVTTLSVVPGTAGAPAGMADSQLSITGNATLAEASGNRADNSGAFQSGSDALASSQMNTASVGATAQSDAFLGTPTLATGLVASSIAVENEVTSALARGNLVQNSVTLNGLAAAGGAGTASAGRFDTAASAPAALVSVQSNHGAILANAGSTVSVPLNRTGYPVGLVGAALNGNSTSATAYANGAANTMTTPLGQVLGIALVSSQYNDGSVQARVTAAPVTFNAGDVRSSNLSLSGNAVTATATGNIATNVIGTMH